MLLFVSGDVYQDSTGKDGFNGFHTQILKTVAAHYLVLGEPVVEPLHALVHHPDVSQAVELGADLAKLANDEFVVVDEPAGEGPTGGRAWDGEGVGPIAEQGHPMLVLAAQLVYLPGFNQFGGLHHLVGGYPVGSPGLVCRAPAGRPPVALVAGGHHHRLFAALFLFPVAIFLRQAGWGSAQSRPPARPAEPKSLNLSLVILGI